MIDVAAEQLDAYYSTYSVMQSDGNSFCGDVVLGSFNQEYREEDRIWGEKYEKQIFW